MRLPIAILLASCAALHAEAVKANDRIAFFGDSITQGGNKPDGYVGLVKAALLAKHADLHLEFIPAGISGHKVTDLAKRVDKDVIEKKATLVIIYIGINDVWHRKTLAEVTANQDPYRTTYQELVAKLNGAGIRTMLCTPSVIGEKKANEPKNDQGLEAYSTIVRELATASKSTLVDLRAAFIAHLAANNAADAGKGILTGDGVHLNAAGNRLVAECILKALGEELPAAK